jgi:ABC-type bacteriocin/lantibiotic exporter with double-glycine peptidase domain
LPKNAEQATKGTTLYDMKQVLSQHGVKFEGYECSKNDFNNLKPPLIAQIISFENANHFVILKSITRDRIEIFCPVEGFRVLNKHDFLEEWTGKILMSPLNRID